MGFSEAWQKSASRVHFAVSAQRSGFETQAPGPMPSDTELTIAAEQGEEPLSQGITHLDDLPDEVICKILEHSGRLEKCFLAQTSSRFLRLASQDYLWASEPAKSSFLRALALCMSSVLHLPHQVCSTYHSGASHHRLPQVSGANSRMNAGHTRHSGYCAITAFCHKMSTASCALLEGCTGR